MDNYVLTKEGFGVKKLGFLWFWIAYFSVGVFVYIVYMTFLPPSEGANLLLNASGMLDILSMVFAALIILYIINRYSATKYLVLIVGIFSFVPSILTLIYELTLSVYAKSLTFQHIFDTSAGLVTNLLFSAIPVVYFFTSNHAKSVLTVPFGSEISVISGSDKSFFNLRKFTFWRNLLIHFTFFAIVGHILEYVYCAILRIVEPASYDVNSEVWTSFILKPFFIYGYGTLACILIFFPLKFLIYKIVKRKSLTLLISFVINASFCTLIEFIMGAIYNPYSQALGRRILWDYTDQPFNFMGQICLRNTIAFGVISTLITWVVYPKIESLFTKIGQERMVVVSLILIVLLSAIFVLLCLDQSNAIPNIEMVSHIQGVIYG